MHLVVSALEGFLIGDCHNLSYHHKRLHEDLEFSVLCMKYSWSRILLGFSPAVFSTNVKKINLVNSISFIVFHFCVYTKSDTTHPISFLPLNGHYHVTTGQKASTESHGKLRVDLFSF